MSTSIFYAKYTGDLGQMAGVISINGLTGAISLVAGTGITITPSGNNLTISTTGMGTVTAVTASSPLFSSGGTTPNITIQVANSTQNGYLSSTDWNTFNNKLTSTLSSGDIFVGNASNVATAVAMSGDISISNTGATSIVATTNSTITTLSALSLPVSQLTGVLSIVNGGTNSSTALTNNKVMVSSGGAIVELASAGTAGQVLTSNGVSSLPSFQTPVIIPADIMLTDNHILVGNASNFAADVAMSGDASIVASGALTLNTVNSNVGSFGSSTSIPSFTVNAKGLITAASGNVVIAPAGTLTGTTLASNVVTSSLTSLGVQSQALNMGSHLINAVLDPVSSQDAATKNYVDMSVAALQPATSVYAATAGSNISGTYNNGVAGVGATFTTTSTATFTVDGTTPPVGSRILIKDQSSGFQNGIYVLTTAAVPGISGTVFTRAFDYDTPSDMNSAGLIPVINGTVNALSAWQQIAVITTVGTDALVFQEFTANPSLYLLKANNLSDVASKAASFNNLNPMTTTGDIIYESSTGVASRLGIGSTGNVLTVTGGVPVWSAPATSGTVTSVGLAAPSIFTVSGSPVTSSGTLTLSYSGTALPIANGGTGDTSFTANQIVIGGTTSTGPLQQISAGTSGQILTSNGSGAPTWSTSAPISGFTPGSVIFAGATGQLAQDNAEFFWDNTNFRLGIGTAVPDSPLTISTNTATLPIPGTTATGTLLHVGGADGTKARILIDAFSNGVSATTNAKFTARTAAGTAASPTATQANNDFATFSGVGYGTTGYGNGGGAIIFTASQNWTDTANGTDLRFLTTGNGSSTAVENMRLTHGGNLLIGTTTDTGQLLQVNGTSIFAGQATLSVAPVMSTLTGYLYGNGSSPVTAATTIPTSSLSGTVSLTTQVSGLLPVANGGTGVGSFTANQVIIAGTTSTGPMTVVAAGTTGQVLTAQGSSAPIWATPTTGTVTSVTGSGNIASSGGNTPNITFTGVLPIANGGTNSTDAAVLGGIVYTNATQHKVLAAGTAGQVLQSNGAAAPSWVAATSGGTVTSVAMSVPSFLSISGSPITSSGTLAVSYSGTALPIANGGTANTSMSYVTLTDGATITWTVAGLINNAEVTLGGNRTLAFSGILNGMTGTLVVKQDGTGSRTLALPSGSKVINGGGGAVILSTAANAIDILAFTYDGTNYFWTVGNNYT